MSKLKSIFLSSRILLLLLLFSTNSSPAFAAMGPELPFPVQEDQHQDQSPDLVGEELSDLFQSVLPAQNDLHFAKAPIMLSGAFEAFAGYTQIITNDYIKASRYILPSLGIRELIFPFHVFL